MKCNALGALCDKICNYCAVRALCDCSSNNIVIVADFKDPEAKEFIRQLIHMKDRDLIAVINAVEEQKHSPRTEFKVHRVIQKKIAEKDKIEAAILDISKRNLATLKEDAGNEEGWSRLTLACHLAKLDLMGKFSDLNPITAKELRALETQVAEVKKYGSAAATIWREICALADWKDLAKIAILTPRQISFLRKQLKKIKRVEINHSFFNELSIERQKIFLEAAKLFPDAYLAQKQKFEAWADKDSKRSSPKLGSQTPSTSDADEKEEKHEN